MPVKLERREAHPLWGDVLAEYVWSIWMPVAGTAALAPRFAFRMADGEVRHQRQVPRYAFAPPDTTIDMSIPSSAVPLIQATLPVDTVRVAENTFLLRSPSYTNVVTLQADTVWILDAQVGEERARQDSAWVGRLFPGRHPVVLVVTDLAHPHISGVRFWVASGATVISHAVSREFLDRVTSRRWTLLPDKLELTQRARFRFAGVSDGQARAGGRVQLIPIGGVASEGALMVYLPGQRFLYAGDFIQQGSAASFTVVYAREVLAAVRRAGLTPASFAAMHVPLTAWSDLARFGATPTP
jgi:glyoxylase-like metal-dependent hydrolase (beta-lactamase superfamily II)